LTPRNYHLIRSSLGTHHAFFDRGEGYCVFNDLAVAANLALVEFPLAVEKILVIDLDVHQGNGTASLFKNDMRVFTFSMHCKSNFFSDKELSDVDVELAKGTEDDEYLHILKSWLPWLFDHVKPNLVFYQAGVDVYAEDRLGHLKLSREGIQNRNELVFSHCRDCNVPLVVTLGGGYPKDDNPLSLAYHETIECHMDVYKQLLKFRY
jgi:acetoin utilization deacetylase AcuC-like enzyme